MKNTTDLSSSELKCYLEFTEDMPQKEFDVKGKTTNFASASILKRSGEIKLTGMESKFLQSAMEYVLSDGLCATFICLAVPWYLQE